VYFGTAAPGTFTESRTFVTPNKSVMFNGGDVPIHLAFSYGDTSEVQFGVLTYPDGNANDWEVSAFPIEIRVYPA